MNDTQIQVFMVEDHPAVRQGLSLLLQQQSIVVTGEAESAAEAEKALETVPCHVVIVDISLAGESGLALVEKLQQRQPPLPCLVYSMHEEPAMVERALTSGALAFVNKRDPASVLVEAVRAVHAGERYLSPRIAAALAARLSSGKGAGVDSLSMQERRVYDLLGQGFGLAEIGEQLAISPRTVESYCSRINERLGLAGMRELRRHAIAYRKG